MMAHRQPGLAQQQDMGEQHQAGERPESLRADAQQNRDRILEVARDALAVSGDASLNSIAKRAGVGPGTLYRHFPTREALVLAVYRHDVQQLADSAAALLKEHPPLEALRLWLDRLAYYGRIKHGLADVLHAATSDGLVGETYGPVIRAITLLLRACEEAGSVRPGLDPDDVLLLMGFLWRIDASDDWQARASRMLDLVMDGLRTGAPAGPAPGMTHPSAPLHESRGLTTPYRLSLLSNINNNLLVRKACAAHPGLGQQALYTLTSAPGLLVWGCTLFLIWRVIRAARRTGPFTVHVAVVMRRLGWVIILGSAAAALIQEFALNQLLNTMLTQQSWFGDLVIASIKGLLPVPALAGAALLTLARIIRLGADMDDEIKGTV